MEGIAQRALFWRRFRRHRLGVIGGARLVLLGSLALAAPWIAPYGYGEMNLGSSYGGPSLAHPMGTDHMGYDWLTQILYGARLSLTMALAVGVLSTLVGTAVGLVSGYYGGTFDLLFMGLTDLGLTLPFIPVLLVAGLNFGFTPVNVALALTLLLWPRVARVVRAQALSVRGRQYVDAAKALGVPDTKIMLRHLLPNTAGVVVVQATLTLSTAVLAESTLSYLAVYLLERNRQLAPIVFSDVYSWGALLGEQHVVVSHWWLAFFPGAMIALTILCLSFLGDALGDALDPRSGP